MTGGGGTEEVETNVDDAAVGRPNLIDESQDQANDTESEPEVVEIIEYVTVKRPAPVTPGASPE